MRNSCVFRLLVEGWLENNKMGRRATGRGQPSSKFFPDETWGCVCSGQIVHAESLCVHALLTDRRLYLLPPPHCFLPFPCTPFGTDGTPRGRKTYTFLHGRAAVIPPKTDTGTRRREYQPTLQLHTIDTHTAHTVGRRQQQNARSEKTERVVKSSHELRD